MGDSENTRLAVSWPHDRFVHGVEGVDDLTTEFSAPLRDETAKRIRKLARENDVPLRESTSKADVVTFASPQAEEAAEGLDLVPGEGSGSDGAYTVEDVKKASA